MSHTISVGVMVKNEADRLARSLASVSWADEIVVLDSGSTDDTLAIARSFTDKVFIRDDWEGFGEQRRRLHDLCSGDWIMMLDADEVVSPELAEALIELREQPCDKAYKVYWTDHIFGKRMRFGGWSSYKLCVYPKAKGVWDPNKKVHEHLALENDVQVVQLKQRMDHYGIRDMEHFAHKHALYAKIFAEQSYAKGKRVRLLDAFTHSFVAFLRRYIIKLGFLDGGHGLLLAVLSGHAKFLKYSYLWTLQQQHKQSETSAPE